MTRQELWDKMKAAGITRSKRQDCPPDADLKVVLQCCQVSGKTLIDFICSTNKKPAVSIARDPENPML